MESIGLYIHIPFCRKRCGYCDFYSTTEIDTEPAFVEALVTEMKNRIPGHSVDTVFIGGGTPSVLSTEGIQRICGTVIELSGCEIEEFSCEANPESLTAEKAKVLRDAGVNRLSIGVQSLVPEELITLGRIHSVEDVGRAIESARMAGFDNVGVDLIFGIPGQSVASWSDTLRRAIAFEPEHVSTYGLTWEEGTAFHSMLTQSRLHKCDEEIEASMYEVTLDTLSSSGFRQYEISNFSIAGRECRHNLNYWRNGAFVGVGPSAVGYLSGTRYRNIPDLDAYNRGVSEKGNAVAEEEALTGVAYVGECLMLGLRRNEGMDLSDYAESLGESVTALLRPELDRFSREGLLIVDGDRVRLSRTGMLVADTILAELMNGLDRAVDGVDRGC